MNVHQTINREDPDVDTALRWAPPVAPLAMPRQVLEHPARKTLVDQLMMVFFPRERI